MENAIKTEKLVKTYRKKGKRKGKTVNALIDLNLTVKLGDIYGFIGPNGAGKTTTIKTLMGLITADSGAAFVMGYPAGTVEAKKEVGYLSEVAYYYPFMEVGKLLDFYCSFYEIKRPIRKKRITEVLRLVGLEDKIDAKMSELSKGMQQKFGIAQAIIADPPLLILDELTSGLDPIAQKEVKDVVLQLKKQGKTIFFSSHQMTEVENICDQIGIIHRGVMLKSARLDEFLKEESGNLTKIVFSDPCPEFLNRLKEKSVTLEAVHDKTYRIIVSESEVNNFIDLMRSEKLPVLEVSPHRFSLEDAFFRLIKEDEK